MLSKADFKKEELSVGHRLTVQALMNFVEKFNIPKDARVLVQRVEDGYFEGFSLAGFSSADGILPEGTKSNPWRTYKKMQEGHPVEYVPAWGCVHYKDDEDILFIDLHY